MFQTPKTIVAPDLLLNTSWKIGAAKIAECQDPGVGHSSWLGVAANPAGEESSNNFWNAAGPRRDLIKANRD